MHFVFLFFLCCPQGVMVDRTLYISGQLGLTSSGDMVEGGVTSEAQQVKCSKT